jgi:hypothetical protein
METILSFYLAFLFLKKSKYKLNRLLCISSFLYRMMRRRKPDTDGIFKRFNINCIGKQLTFEMMRSEKAVKYNELRKNRHSRDFEWWFLRYIPHIKKEEQKIVNKLVIMKRNNTKRKKSKKKMSKQKKGGRRKTRKKYR